MCVSWILQLNSIVMSCKLVGRAGAIELAAGPLFHSHLTYFKAADEQ